MLSKKSAIIADEPFHHELPVEGQIPVGAGRGAAGIAVGGAWLRGLPTAALGWELGGLDAAAIRLGCTLAKALPAAKGVAAAAEEPWLGDLLGSLRGAASAAFVDGCLASMGAVDWAGLGGLVEADC